MEKRGPAPVTRLLADIDAGGPAAAERLFPLVYAELRAIAGRCFRRESPGLTLQPTALVHEAYLHLSRPGVAFWESRAHFFAVAATAIRQILIQHARKRAAMKRGGRRERVTLAEGTTPAPSGGEAIDLLALDEALERLAGRDERGARIVQLKFFGGLSTEEIADLLGLARSTVEDDWRVTRAWLRRELSRGEAT